MKGKFDDERVTEKRQGGNISRKHLIHPAIDHQNKAAVYFYLSDMFNFPMHVQYLYLLFL